ncbi:MAG: DEAD/DEAH box helicase [Candidatus Methanomethylophilus sp.]|nr:DEAD/DEAH box helicase [Methanomethylophilus sp.]MDD3233352.1 DEAD/DEAH box helicase [Methanomethylophilus sp.]MDD4222567.1 DEAD/DEAH box helicase [Methanomethylophilus sp.]MDD4668951.1 DEAD/DEAH box helicase [Methanomethylophilus sp.]
MTAESFEDLGIGAEVLRAIRSVGWTEPTPVQIAAIPVGLTGSDLFAEAQTGTGKTGTYGSIILSKTKSGAQLPTALVLTPTRELALQVAEELDRLAKYTGHRSLPIYGGVSVENQVRDLKKGADIIIGTPGRLKDLLERKVLNLSAVGIVVLDEADRMLDMGFLPDVNMILSKVPKKRQTMMFSATMTDDVKKLAVKHMINHRELLISKDEPTLDLTAQFYIMTDRDSKRDELIHLIEDGYPKLVVFCHTKRKVDYLSRKLKRDEYSVGAIHGDMAQNKRERTIKAFADGDIEVLVASDVAARGLDFENVDIVVNYDIPSDPESYIHRIGRTGRAGHQGKAITFVTADDVKMLNEIEKTVGRRIVELPPTSPNYLPEQPSSPKQKAKQVKQKQAVRKEAAQAAIKAQAAKEQQRRPRQPTGGENAARTKKGRTRQEEPTEMPGRTLKGKLSRPQPRGEKRLSDRPGRERNGGQPAVSRPAYPKPQGVPAHPRPVHAYVQIEKAPPVKPDNTSYDRLEISVGSKDGVTPDVLTKFVIKHAGVSPKDLGNVHVYDNKSRIQVVKSRAQEVVDEVFGQTFKGRRVMVYNLSDIQ